MAEELQFPEIPEVQMRAAKNRFPAFLLFKREKSCVKFHCSRCEKEWETVPPEQVRLFTPVDADLLSVKHKDRVKCPYCGTECTAISIARISTGKSLNHSLCFRFFIQRGADELFVRSLFINRIWSDSRKSLEWKTNEFARYYLAPGRGEYFYPSWFRISGFEWNNFDRPQEYPREAELIGDTNLEHTFLKYNSYELYHRANPDDSAYIRYLCYYARYPLIEQLVKAGYSDFVRDLIVNNNPNKSVIDFTAPSIKVAFRKVRIEDLRRRKTAGVYDSCRLMRQTVRLRRYGSKAFDKAAFYLRIIDGMGVRRDADAIHRVTGVDYERMHAYLCGQMRDPLIATRYRTYFDYIDQAQKIDAFSTDTGFLFPRDLVTAHDRIAGVYNAKLEAERLEKSKELLAKRARLTKRLCAAYCYEDEHYTVVVPQIPDDIICEGKALRHCVAGYADRHFSGTTVIVFIRRKEYPNVSFFTVEISPKTGEFRQVRGHANCPPEDSVKAFCDAWQSEIQKRRKKKEKKSRKTA